MLYGLMIVTVGFYRLTNPDPHIARHPPFNQSHIITVQKRFEFKLSVAASHTSLDVEVLCQCCVGERVCRLKLQHGIHQVV
jgi:hypothetical protein